jgi:hypothetical protein
VTIDWNADRRAAAARLLTWSDTAVIADAALLLVLERERESMSLICESLAAHETAGRVEEQETILWVFSAAWESGAVDVPALLQEVEVDASESARRGVTIAREWLDTSG